MNNRNWLSLNEVQILYKNMQPYRRYCKCGHTVYVMNKSGRAECRNCHNLVFKDKKTEFEYIMKRKLIEEKRKLK